jgi:spore coat polysaccharide biosynthesis protein SpsF
MRYLPIILARMNSTRLPGKVMMDLCGKPVLERIIERIRRVSQIEHICVATTLNNCDKKIIEFCVEKGIIWFAGSEKDVLHRFVTASQNIESGGYEHDYIIDITADCPLACPEIIGNLIYACERYQPDYASNIGVRSFCDGFDVQIVKKEVLYDIYDKVQPYHRCHSAWNVLAYAQGIKVYNLTPAKQEYWMPEVGLTLDTAMDLVVIRQIYEQFEHRDYVFNHYDICELLLTRPEILDVNKNVKRKTPGKDVS